MSEHTKHTKKVEELTIADLEAFPVWQYTNTEEHLGETAVRPIKRVPVKNLNDALQKAGGGHVFFSPEANQMAADFFKEHFKF